MMPRRWVLAILLCLLLTAPLCAADPYSIKTTTVPPPQDVAEPIRKLLAERCVQLLDASGEVMVEVWPRSTVSARATEAQVKNGLTYREIPETTILAVLRVGKPWTDYRKQKIPVGVYTLRLAYQPVTDDHANTAPYSDFGLLCPATDDISPDLLEAKALHELSTKTTGHHPGVYLLFPVRDPGEPKLLNKGAGHWVLQYRQDVRVGDARTTLGVGVTLVGATAS